MEKLKDTATTDNMPLDKQQELSELGEALLKCAYSIDPIADTEYYYRLLTRNSKNISGKAFCKSANELVNHHMHHTNKMVKSLARFISIYRDEVKEEEETPERKEAREQLTDDLKCFLLHDYRPND